VTVKQSRNAGAFDLVHSIGDEAVSATIGAGGSGYTLNDILTVSGGTLAAGGVAAQFRVTGVNAGAVTAVALEHKGEYTTTPGNPTSTTGGTGTGATLNVTYRKALLLRIFSASGTFTAINVKVTVNGEIVV
jgi:hypothetical protein